MCFAICEIDFGRFTFMSQTGLDSLGLMEHKNHSTDNTFGVTLDLKQ